MMNLLKASSRLAGTLFAAGLVAAAQGGMAQPGTLNYTEGQVSINGNAVRASHNTAVQPGQVLQTQDGKAEMLLTPGVFLRLNNHSQARMVSDSITNTRIELLQGEAMVEAAQVEMANNLTIADAGASTQIDKRGIYQFNADQPKVAVFDGEVTVTEGDHSVNVKKGHELALVAQNEKLKTQSFNVNNVDPLYSWSRLRSEYMAEANMSSAQTIVVSNPSWFYGTGWYWNPYFSSWAFVPGGGYFYSPFGFGFYSPAYWGVYGRGIIGRGYFGGYGAYRPGVAAVSGFRGAAAPMVMRGGFGGGGGHFGGRR
jgi:ferric-dicitrate binding protein FerR (iron transport regulator)